VKGDRFPFWRVKVSFFVTGVIFCFSFHVKNRKNIIISLCLCPDYSVFNEKLKEFLWEED
jgi:hypothetical protein